MGLEISPMERNQQTPWRASGASIPLDDPPEKALIHPTSPRAYPAREWGRPLLGLAPVLLPEGNTFISAAARWAAATGRSCFLGPGPAIVAS